MEKGFAWSNHDLSHEQLGSPRTSNTSRLSLAFLLSRSAILFSRNISLSATLLFFFPPLYDLSSIFRLGNSSTDRIAIIVISEGSLTALNIFLFFFFCSTEIRDYVEHSVHKIIFEIALKLFAAVLGSQFFCTAIRDSLRDLRLTSVAVSTRFRVTCRQLSENSAR